MVVPEQTVPLSPAALRLREELDKSLLKQCVHCGLCLDYCPTYLALGLENDSPRGRIYQVRQVYEGRISPDDPKFQLHIHQCLDCRACQTACPSGVQYGKIIEAARAIASPPNPIERTLGRRILNGVFTSNRALDVLGAALRLYDRSGLRRLVQRSGALKLLGLDRLEALLPPLQGGLIERPLPPVTPALGERRYRVGFVAGCVMSRFLPETNRATVRLLALNGCEVVTPPEQGCCGALHNHVGERAMARALARRNIAVFESLGLDAIIVNAAGCGSTLKEYGELLRRDPDWAERAHAFSAKVKDVTEFLAAIPLKPPTRPIRRRVTYQDACHLAHGQGVRAQPRQLLRMIPGLELVELKDADACCGSAGIYNLTHPDLARRILEPKLDNLAATGAEIVVAPNPGCAFQLAAGIRQRGLQMAVAHVVDLLDQAYR